VKTEREVAEAAVVVEEAEVNEAPGEVLMVKKDQKEEEEEVVKEVPGEVLTVKQEVVIEGEVIEEEVTEEEEPGEVEETMALMPKDLKLSKLVVTEILEEEAEEEVPGEVLTAKKEEVVTEGEEPTVNKEADIEVVIEEEEIDHQEEVLVKSKKEIFLELPLPPLCQPRLRNE